MELGDSIGIMDGDPESNDENTRIGDLRRLDALESNDRFHIEMIDIENIEKTRGAEEYGDISHREKVWYQGDYNESCNTVCENVNKKCNNGDWG